MCPSAGVALLIIFIIWRADLSTDSLNFQQQESPRGNYNARGGVCTGALSLSLSLSFSLSLCCTHTHFISFLAYNDSTYFLFVFYLSLLHSISPSLSLSLSLSLSVSLSYCQSILPKVIIMKKEFHSMTLVLFLVHLHREYESYHTSTTEPSIHIRTCSIDNVYHCVC